MNQPFFTIFTPVYNGELHIGRVFESVVNQTFRNFEWIIVNDGSTDNSHNLIKLFIDQHPEIFIIYIEQDNSGKHIAWNKAVDIARGELFVPADADDSFLPDTLSFFYKNWNALSSLEKVTLSGINVLCFDNETDNIVGSPFPIDGMKSNNLELEFKYKNMGEKWGCVRSDLLKARHFPIVKGAYYPESYLWLHFAKNYKAICFNKPFRRYYTTETGITQTPLAENSIYQAKIFIRCSLWFLKNFGLYLLINSPTEIFKTAKLIIINIIIIIKRSVHIN
jgi:glycosyltransferase involved in cell wall biosynthesis